MNKEYHYPTLTKDSYIGFKISKQKKAQIKAKALEHNQNISEFIMFCVDNVIYNRTQSNGKSSNVLTELGKISELVSKLEEKEFSMTMLMQNLSNKPSETNISLEEQILSNLGEKRLFLNQIATYCDESPAKVLETLVKLQKEGTVEQSARKRWYRK
ncbi:hypothetical protein [Candidatus Lokiarchaeum ossiferum]|uniref:hypothetical protein n=1 Tax=Candidatus Lokiarchaeum ossiferum TaxID=2951803 RepID=UPI00352C7AA8